MSQRYNILYVISDQHNAQCMGCEGHSQAITPNMDRLAGMGVRFTNAYAQNAICTPSRVSILSGQYCHNHGYYGLSGTRPLHLPSFLGHFREHGYRTAAIGKIHTPNDPKDWIIDHVDSYKECYEYGPTSEPSPYYRYLEERGLRQKEDSVLLPEFSGNQQHDARPSLLPFEHSVEGWCVSEAVRFIEECDKQPFCMEVSLPRPHQCYTPDKQFWDMYSEELELPETIWNDCSHRPPHFRQMVADNRSREWYFEPKTFEAGSRRVWRGYLACITQVDHSLGLLLDYLKRHNMMNNTIVIYGADHGAYSGMFGIPEKAPGICSEAVCRVPFIWYVPGITKAGHVCQQLVENLDLVPTITSLCGLSPMDTTDGQDITDLLKGSDESIRKAAVTENPCSRSIRWESWRLVYYHPEMFKGQNIGELYNTQTDPNETKNMFFDPDCQSLVREGHKILLDWLIGTTRNVSIWPSPDCSRSLDYPLGADGKEANWAGPKLRIQKGYINYL